MVLMKGETKREDIVKTFLDKGFQLDPKSLEFFLKNADKITTFFAESDKIKPKPAIITIDFLSRLFKKQEVKQGIGVIRDFIPRKRKTKEGKFSVEDHAHFFNNRYDRLRGILTGRTSLSNLLSINKITQRTKKFSIVAMVTSIDRQGSSLVVEDKTGQLTVNFLKELSDDFNQIVCDEVVGLVCESSVSGFNARRIIWPDVPLKRSVKRAKEDVHCLFISDLHMDSKKFNKDSYKKFMEWLERTKTKFDKFYIFILGDVSTKMQDIKKFFSTLPPNSRKIYLNGEIDPETGEVNSNVIKISSPSIINVEGTTFLLLHGNLLANYADVWGDASPEQIMVNLLRKRNLNPTIDFTKTIYDEDPFILDVIPDVFACGHFHRPGALNYKGTTIISNGSFISDPTFFSINLKTREINKLSFA